MVPDFARKDMVTEVLRGGLTNRVYKLSHNGATYVLRLPASVACPVGVDRHHELRVLRQASAVDLAPELVYANAEAGILLLRYIEGQVWTRDDLVVPGNLERLADVLRRVHALPLSGKTFEPATVATGYIGNLNSAPELLEFGHRCRSVVTGIESTGVLCCCHNDVVVGNVIARPNLMLLDWEYACDNEPLYDLASVIDYHSFDQTHADILLDAYCGGITLESRERLAGRIRRYQALLWLWLASRQASVPGPDLSKWMQDVAQSLGKL